MIIGIDAVLPLTVGRGWARYAKGVVSALAEANELKLRVLVPEAAFQSQFARSLATHVNVDVLQVGPQYLPEEVLGAVDVLHVLTRYCPETGLRPLVVTVHDVSPLAKRAFRCEQRGRTLAALQQINEAGAEIVAVSEATRRELVERASVDPRRVHVIYPGVDEHFLDHGLSQRSTSRRQPYVLYVGGAGENKNLGNLVRAAGMLWADSGVETVLVGAREWGYDTLRIADGAGCVHIGKVDDDTLAALYQNAVALVFPSLHEGFGLPIVEAMACGCPVVCSSIPVFEEIAGDSAMYCDPEDPAKIAGAVRTLLGDENLRTELIRAGVARAGRFRWSRCALRLASLYEAARQSWS
jgi:glycosyltransferase involved in cell wall biosynthesis